MKSNAIFGAILLSLSGMTAQASQIHLRTTAVVTSFSASEDYDLVNCLNLQAGDVMAIDLFYESSAGDLYPYQPNFGYYNTINSGPSLNPWTQITINGATTALSAVNAWANIFNNYRTTEHRLEDGITYYVDNSPMGMTCIDGVSQLPINFARMFLKDKTLRALNNDALPTSAPDVSKFDSKQLIVSHMPGIEKTDDDTPVDQISAFEIFGTITSMEVIPE